MVLGEQWTPPTTGAREGLQRSLGFWSEWREGVGALGVTGTHREDISTRHPRADISGRVWSEAERPGLDRRPRAFCMSLPGRAWLRVGAERRPASVLPDCPASTDGRRAGGGWE